MLAAFCCGCSAAVYRPVVPHDGSTDELALHLSHLRITAMGEGIPPPGRGDGVQVSIDAKASAAQDVGPPRWVRDASAGCSSGIVARGVGSGNPVAQPVHFAPAASADLDYVFSKAALQALGWPDKTSSWLAVPVSAEGKASQCLRLPVIESVSRVEWSYRPSLSLDVAPRVFAALGGDSALSWGWSFVAGVGTWLGPVHGRIQLGAGKAYERDHAPGARGSFSAALLGGSADMIAARFARFGIGPELGYDAVMSGDGVAYHGPRAAFRLAYLPAELPHPPFDMRADAWSLALVPSFSLWFGTDHPMPVLGISVAGDVGL
jgi:hypothetical protein